MRRVVVALVLAVVAGVVTSVGVARPAAAVSPGVTDLVSVGVSDDNGYGGDDHDVSADGRWVAFTSGDPDSPQVYVRDLVTRTTELVTLRLNADDAVVDWDGFTSSPSISGDGRFVTAWTTATLGGALDPGRKVLRIDRDPNGDGVFDELPANLLVSAPAGDGAAETATEPSISDDGSVIAYLRGDGPYLRVATIAPGTATVVRRSAYPVLPDVDTSVVLDPAVSGDGTRVAVPVFSYESDSPAPDDGYAVVVFNVADIDSEGDVEAVRVDVDTAGQQVGQVLTNTQVQVTDDGTRVAFDANVRTSGGEFPTFQDVSFIGDADPDGDGELGPDPLATLLSQDNNGNLVRSRMAAISGDGRYAAFTTNAANSHNGVSINPEPYECLPGCQVVARDLVLDAERAAAGLPRLPGELASPSLIDSCDRPTPSDVCPTVESNNWPVFSRDGGVVAFESYSDELTAGDVNGRTDVFARQFTPDVVVDPNPLDFGDQQIGDSATDSVTISGEGFGPLVITGVTVTGVDNTDFTLGATTCGLAIHAGEQCVVSVAFTPTAEGERTGEIVLTPRADDLVDSGLVGNGTARPLEPAEFAVSPDPLDFGERLTLSDSAPGVLTVTNNGERALAITAVTLPPLVAPSAPEDYRVVAETCTAAPVASGASCTVTVIHNPKAAGDRPAVLQIDDTQPGGTVTPHLVRLLGRGTAPVLLVNPAVVPAGRLTTVLGTGFPPLAAVQVTMPGFPEAFTATTDAAGAFTSSVVVYPNSVSGSRVVDASVLAGPTPIGDTENLLVVPGSMGPPDFLARR